MEKLQNNNEWREKTKAQYVSKPILLILKCFSVFPDPINLKGIKWMHRTLDLSDEAFDGVFLYGFYRSSKEAPRNIAKEAGRTGRNTAGNWCGEQEECLSTKPTQTQASSLNLLFTPQPLGTFLSDISIPPKLEQLLWLCRDVFSGQSTFYLLEVQYHKANSDRILLTLQTGLSSKWQLNRAHRSMTWSHTACLT